MVETTVDTSPVVGEDIDWDAAPLADVLPEHIQAGKRSWQDVTLSEALRTGWRGPLLWTRE